MLLLLQIKVLGHASSFFFFLSYSLSSKWREGLPSWIPLLAWGLNTCSTFFHPCLFFHPAVRFEPAESTDFQDVFWSVKTVLACADCPSVCIDRLVVCSVLLGAWKSLAYCVQFSFRMGSLGCLFFVLHQLLYFPFDEHFASFDCRFCFVWDLDSFSAASLLPALQWFTVVLVC